MSMQQGPRPGTRSDLSHTLFRLGRPLSPIYSLAMRIRQRAYDRGLLPSFRVERPVISIGNLSLGGTGKTPHVIHVCRLLKEEGFRAAVITRGYGGRAGKGPLVVSDGSKVLAGPERAGDEAFMLASLLPGVPVVAGSRRVTSARLAIRRLDADLLVLDDGFQHLSLKRDLDVVLFPATAPFGTGRVFPGGDLREPVSAISRADAGVITGLDPSGCDVSHYEEGHYEDGAELARAKIHRSFPELPLFFSRTRPAGLKWWDFEAKRASSASLDALTERALPVWAFCAIAAPERFFSLCRSCFSDVVGETPFRDHFVFRPRDLRLLFQRARESGARALVCTEKDWVKIEPLLGRLPGGLPEGMKIGALLISVEVDRAFDDLVIRAAKGEFKGTSR